LFRGESHDDGETVSSARYDMLRMMVAPTGARTIERPKAAFDPRFAQITAQSTLLFVLMACLDFGPSPLQAAVCLVATLTIECLRVRTASAPANFRSALPTGLSLCLLLRTHDPLLWIVAPVIALGSKYLLRVNGKHLFNPSAFAIVVLLLATHSVWVSPGQWGTRIWLLSLAGSMGCLVLARVERLDFALTFLAAHVALLLLRAWSLGDPITIPLHQTQSGALLIFALFMLTDPRTTPDSRIGRLVFALAVAAVGHRLMFRYQIREGLLYALILVSCATPLLDRLWPAPRYIWPINREEY
jgi:Na+-transporting NADH:ubiquinone oxidoreductase subunit NqrB